MTTLDHLEMLRMEILNYARLANRKMVNRIVNEAVSTADSAEDIDESQRAEQKSMIYYAMEGKLWKNGSYSVRGH